MSQPWQEHHGWMVGKIFLIKRDTTNPHSPIIKAGTKVKCVMVSRFGDCGVMTNLMADNGYTNRVLPTELEEIPGMEYDLTVVMPDFYKTLHFMGPVEQIPLKDLHRITDSYHPCEDC